MDEKAGFRRDAVRSQVVDVLEAQETKETATDFRVYWWRRLDSNQRPTDYETVALTT
jgi:hypothetical protein